MGSTKTLILSKTIESYDKASAIQFAIHKIYEDSIEDIMWVLVHPQY